MSLLLDPIEDRLSAILCDGYGLTLSSHAAIVGFPEGRFRRSFGGAPLDDVSYAPEDVDRAIFWNWLEIGDDPDPSNEMDPWALRTAVVELWVGYMSGDGRVAQVSVAEGTSESADAAVRAARKRALGEADSIRQALCWGEFWAGTDPAIYNVTRDGRTSLRDLQGGKLLSVTRYAIGLQRSNSSRYDP